MLQPNSEPAVLAALQQFGPVPGGKAMMEREILHAQEAFESGVYCTFTNNMKKSECYRVGSQSLCFCGHFFGNHVKAMKKGPIRYPCGNCPCKDYRFMFQRPEEQGLWWLPRRKGFDVHKWRATCTCKHNHEAHDPNTMKCRAGCGCYAFTSEFPCLVCDAKWEDHEVLYETREERKALGKSVDEGFVPMSSNPEIQKIYNKKTGRTPLTAEDTEENKGQNAMVAFDLTSGNSKSGVTVQIQMPKHSGGIRPKQPMKPTEKEKSIKLMEKAGAGAMGGYSSENKARGIAIRKEAKKTVKEVKKTAKEPTKKTEVKKTAVKNS
jgi:hypothetical protein